MLVAVGHVVAALVAVAALVVKLGALLRDPKDQKIWASVAICLGCGLAVTVGWAPVHSAVDQFTRVPNLAKLAEHGSALLTATAIQFLFLHLGDPQRARRQIRRRLVLLAVVFTVMATMFWAADFPTSEPLHFADRYGDLPEVGVYMLAFLLYLAVSVADILRMSLGYARYAGTRLKVVMRLLSAGAAFGGAYVGHKAFFIALKLADGSAPWSEPVVSQTLVTLSVSFTCSSFVLSTIWKFVDDLRVWPRRSEAYRQLHALWYLLYQAVPTIALQPPRRPERARGVAWAPASGCTGDAWKSVMDCRPQANWTRAGRRRPGDAPSRRAGTRTGRSRPAKRRPSCPRCTASGRNHSFALRLVPAWSSVRR